MQITAQVSTHPKNVHTLILNVGGHFVAVIIAEKHALYIDSYAATFARKEIRDFFSLLQRDKRRIFVNDKPIQDASSTHCGLYAVLYAAWYLLPPDKRKKIEFYTTDLARNDRLCVQYIRDLFNTSAA